MIATNYMECSFEAVVTPYEQYHDMGGDGFNAGNVQSFDLDSSDEDEDEDNGDGRREQPR